MNKEIAELDKIKAVAATIGNAIRPKKVYLFGSFARGEQNENSDYDFCAIVDDDVSDTYFLTGKAYRALYDYDCRDVDLIVVKQNVFERRKQYVSFIENVIDKEGVTVYE